jgi:hypothetical protein
MEFSLMFNSIFSGIQRYEVQQLEMLNILFVCLYCHVLAWIELDLLNAYNS